MAKKNTPAKKAAPKKAAPAKKVPAKKTAPKKAAPKKAAPKKAAIAGADAAAITWMPVCLNGHGNLATQCMDRHTAFTIAAGHRTDTGHSVNIKSC